MSQLAPGDRRWLDAAARLALTRLGTTGPFPAAAALIVDSSGLLLSGRGITGQMGRPAAVVAALADARERTEGATAYLTMEPDASDGPYESEAEKLAGSGIARAIIGALDPDKGRRGKGMRALAAGGVEAVAVDHAPSRALIEGYTQRVRRRRPFVTAILAVSSDGMIAGRGGAPVELLSSDAHRWIDVQRLRSDALLTSARAMERNGLAPLDHLRTDLSRPITVVLVGGGDDPSLQSGNKHRVLVVAGDDGSAAGENDNLLMAPTREGRFDLRAVLEAIAGRGVNTVQAEAGARLTEALISAELIDRFHLLDSMIEIGRGGVPATPLGALDARLRAAGFKLQGERLVGANLLRTFERDL